MTLSRREFAIAVPGGALLAGLRTAPSGDDPLGVRKDFPALDEVTFLNTAYSGLLSQPVVDAGREWLESRARQTYYVPQWLEKTDETRRLFARFIGAGEDEIGFLYATSEGENVVVKALDWNAGGQRGRERSRVHVDTGDPDTSRANAGGGAPDGEAPERRPTPAQRSGE
jgi:hypothetical protein